MSTTKVVVVTAPADLQEGYTFDASANGKTFKVTVPAGGVKAGDDIEVPFPPPTDNKERSGDDAHVPPIKGRFKNDLCDCFQTCPCPFFMGWCCSGVLTGQVLQRLKLNPIGMAAGSQHENTCKIMTAVFFTAWLLAIIVGALTDAGYLVWYAFYLYIVVALTMARNHFRKLYQIPGTLFHDDDGGGSSGMSILDDCCCAFWCGCCTILQMHRHTHDEQRYPYDITSPTGLPINAPEITGTTIV